VFASGENVTLPSEMIGFVRMFAGLISGLSIIMIVFGGFKYITAMGDERATESAKSQIVSAGVGLFIALTGNLIASVFLKVGETEPVKPNFPVFPIVFIVLIVIAAFGVLSVALRNKEPQPTGENSDEEKPFEVDVNGHLEFIDFLSNNSFALKPDTTTLHSEDNVFSVRFLLKEGERLNQLIFVSKEKEYLTSTYSLVSKSQNYSLSEGIEFTGDTDLLNQDLLSIHESLIEQYYRQYFSTQDWTDYLLQSVDSRIVKEKTSSLVKYYETILSYHAQLNSEEIFFLEESFVTDLENLLKPYGKLSDSVQISMESSLLERLSTLHKKLEELEQKINTQLERDVLYAFRVIDKKYQDKK
jgi:hypothetical protein